MNFIDYCIATKNYSVISVINNYCKMFNDKINSLAHVNSDDALKAKIRLAKEGKLNPNASRINSLAVIQANDPTSDTYRTLRDNLHYRNILAKGKRLNPDATDSEIVNKYIKSK